MRDDRSIAVKHGWLALGSLALVVMMACGGGGAPAPEGDMAANMETDAAGATLTSDLVERSLPNPNPTVVLDWAPLMMRSAKNAVASILPSTSAVTVSLSNPEMRALTARSASSKVNVKSVPVAVATAVALPVGAAFI